MIANLVSMMGIAGVPEVAAGDDIVELILTAIAATGVTMVDGDVLVVAQKIISKAEGRQKRLGQVIPTEEARRVARQCDKDPCLVELILGESEEISRMRPGVLITRHRLGFTSANAGIDRSNVPQLDSEEETVLLLPLDPDGTAAAIHQEIAERTGAAVGIIISDSHGRPFRLGTVGVAIGAAGLPALWDRRGEADRHGFRLQHTDVAVADELAAAAGLVMGQAAEGVPLVLLRGLRLPDKVGKAADLVRPKAMDLYR